MKTDIRYRGKCCICGKKLGDWSLKVKEPKCFDHKDWDLEKELKPFATPSSEVRQSSMVV